MLWNRNRTSFAKIANTRAKVIGSSIKTVLEDLEGRRLMTVATFTGSPYTQDFNLLPATATAATTTTPTDLGTSVSALNGWSFFKNSGTNTASITYVVNTGTGTGTTGAVYNYGVTTPSTNRSFGTLLSGAQGGAIGAVIQNTSGSTVTDLSISFVGRQWRRGNTTAGSADRLAFSYTTGTTTSIVGSFTANTALDFSSLNTAGTASAMDGTASGNFTTISTTLTGLTWNNGEYLTIKWADVDITGSDDGLAIDDLTLALPTTPPSAASGLTAVVNGTTPSTAIDLSWTDNSNNETGFKIQRTTDPAFLTGIVNVTTTAGDTTTTGDTHTYTDSGLSPGTHYYYRVIATNVGGDASPSNVADTTTATGVPAAPSGLTATTNGTNPTTSVDLSWTDNSGNETSFIVEYTAIANSALAPTAFNAPITTITGIAANSTTYTVTGLEPGIRYAFRVKANNGFGDSTYSNLAYAGTQNSTLTSVSFNGSGTYTQNFDHLNQTEPDNTGLGVGVGTAGGPFTTGVTGVHDLVSSSYLSDKNSAINGWSAGYVAGSDAFSAVRISADDGTSLSGGVHAYGSTSSSDRALGLLTSGSNRVRVGASFTNTSGSTINNLSLAYIAETWRRSANASESATFEYKLGGTAIDDGAGWTAVSAFNATTTGTGATVATDGNNASFRASKSLDLTALGWADGQTLLIRWTDVDDSGNDSGLAIDDFSMQITPANAGTFNMSSSSVRVSEGGTATITVTRSGGTTGTADVNYTLSNVTAQGADYTSPSGVLSFADGELSKDITIAINTDSLDELVQTFNVVLNSVTGTTAPGGAIGTNTTTLVKIVDTNGFAVTAGTPFTQDWSTTNSAITAADQWDNVLDITGFETDAAQTAGTATVLADQVNPGGISVGGVAEFSALADPVVALQGTGTATAPQLIIDLDTTGLSSGKIEFDARDIDDSTDNSVQPITVAYRVGNSGAFTTIDTIADASSGPSLATLVTHFLGTLPGGALGQSLVQIKISTVNAAGNDEWIGIDNINIHVGLPAWLNPTSTASWDSGTQTLNVTGNAEIIADPAASGDLPIINGASALAVLSINPTTDNTVHIASLNFTGGAVATVVSAPLTPTRDAILLATNGLNLGTPSSPTGTLNIGYNNLAVNYGANPSVYADINTYVLKGLTLLGGTGTVGIISPNVDAQTVQGTILGVIDDGDANIAGAIVSLSGQTVPTPASSVLVKFTWFGDSNFDGSVDGSDYALLDSGFTSGGSLGGWVFGDYDYSGVVDGSDYALIDTGFISQNQVL